jgi:hypothetical protein
MREANMPTCKWDAIEAGPVTEPEYQIALKTVMETDKWLAEKSKVRKRRDNQSALAFIDATQALRRYALRVISAWNAGDRI